jgi:hypothetical protein
MVFDLMVLVVSTAGLLRSGGTQGSDLWKLLFRDGIAYFFVAFVGNAVASVSSFVAFTLSSWLNLAGFQVFTILHLNAA